MRHVFLDVETTGLSALVHRVVCIGSKAGGEERALMNRDERRMLEDFLGAISEGDVLVGYNINFDVGFLVLRSLKYEIDPKKLLGRTLIDLMGKIAELMRWEKYVSLRQICAYFGLGGGGTDGALVPGLWEAGEYDQIREHCLSDVRLTEQLFEKLKPLVFELATDRQKDYMRRLGIPFGEDTTKTEASGLIDEFKRGR